MAVVTRQDFRKARLYEQMLGSASVNVIVFTQLNPACIWLGVAMKEAQASISSKTGRTFFLSLRMRRMAEKKAESVA